MNHTETLSRYVANFVDELAYSGLKHVVISPGSRSTPLALTFCEHKQIKEWVIIDERSAAYFALGIAKGTNEPVAILCTSGTAAANYYPAVVEAFQSRIPLLVLTADRSHELRDIGASQAIDQMNMFAGSTKWFQEMALPEASEMMLRYVRSKASQAIYYATEGNPGPVQLNFPFREPLIPDFSLDKVWGERESAYQQMKLGQRILREQDTLLYTDYFKANLKGIIICGPQTDHAFAEAVVDFAERFNYPILADPLSQVRAGRHSKNAVIENYDAILKNNEIRKQFKADFIIRFGAMPVSKPLMFYLKENKDIRQFVVEASSGIREPLANPTEFIYADPVQFCKNVHQSATISRDSTWLDAWKNVNLKAKKIVENIHSEHLMEGEAARILLENLPNNSCIYVGNSMAVRDVDTFMQTTEKNITILANRGSAGIDGVTSSALGAAAAMDKHVTLLIGDLSFYHDLNGLLAAKHYELNLTIVLINNDGGGIFSFLPQANHPEHFEKLFGTPLGLDFSPATSMYGGNHVVVRSASTLESALEVSYQSKGLHVIEVQTNRNENLVWRKSIWENVAEAILIRE